MGNAAFFAVAFAMQMGWLSWDMLGFGQDDDEDDVAVKNPDPEPDPEDAKNTNYTASDYASEQVGTSGKIPLAHQLVRILLRYLPDRERQFSGQFL